MNNHQSEMTLGFVYWVWGTTNPQSPFLVKNAQYNEELLNEKEVHETPSTDKTESVLTGTNGRKLPPVAKSNKYKTKMCRNYMETGKCRYGRVCQFAHGTKELKKYSFCVCNELHCM